MTGLSSAWLRAERPANSIVALSPDDAQILAAALEIADDSARSEIELFAPLVVSIIPNYYDISAHAGIYDLSRAVAYLESRGLIERHPGRPELVRVVEAA